MKLTSAEAVQGEGARAVAATEAAWAVQVASVVTMEARVVAARATEVRVAMVPPVAMEAAGVVLGTRGSSQGLNRWSSG